MSLEQQHWSLSGVFIVNLEHILTLFSSVSFIDFEQVNVCWEVNNEENSIMRRMSSKLISKPQESLVASSVINTYFELVMNCWNKEVLDRATSCASQLTFTFSKLTIEALGKIVKCVQS